MAIIPLVHLVRSQCLLRRRPLPGEGDVAELDTEVTAEADVRIIGVVRVDGLGQRGVVLENSAPASCTSRCDLFSNAC
jgi:hypothetical protein